MYSQTGVPLHFHSSVTSGSASWMSFRNSANRAPRQSSNSATRASIRSSALNSSVDFLVAVRAISSTPIHASISLNCLLHRILASVHPPFGLFA